MAFARISFTNRWLGNWPARIGAAIVLTVCLTALFTEWLAPYAPQATDQVAAANPSWQHWLGTDLLGKDILSRIMYGARLSLLCGVSSMLLAISCGVPIGLIAGYFAGSIDSFLMRSMDIALAFPSVLIALLVSTLLPPGWLRVILAVGIINLPAVARQCRATVLSVRHLDYVIASRALGATAFRTLWREILPSLIGPVVTLATLGMGTAILEVAALSFLGIGGDPTEPEWGSMLSQAKTYWSKNPWAAVGPGFAITLTVLGFNLLGDTLRDALDPQTDASNRHE
jgi:peptide/nickel transport system permease protein